MFGNCTYDIIIVVQYYTEFYTKCNVIHGYSAVSMAVIAIYKVE